MNINANEFDHRSHVVDGCRVVVSDGESYRIKRAGDSWAVLRHNECLLLVDTAVEVGLWIHSISYDTQGYYE